MRALLLSLTLCLVLVAPAGALTRDQIFGIGDVKDPRAFTEKRFKALRATSVRTIIDWDLARTPGFERDRMDAWYEGAVDAGLDPLVTFQGFNQKRRPAVGSYKAAFAAALKRWPAVREWQAWNEANHVGEPITYRHPERAAAYAKAMERTCRRCTIVPLTYVLSNTISNQRWLDRWLAAYGRTPRIWALHTYGDANHFNYNLLKRFIRLHPKGRIWITETGGLATFQDKLGFNLRRQRRATRWAFREALRFRRRVDRMYYWQWYGAVRPRKVGWDSGLVDAAGQPRPAFHEALRQRFKRR